MAANHSNLPPMTPRFHRDFSPGPWRVEFAHHGGAPDRLLSHDGNVIATFSGWGRVPTKQQGPNARLIVNSPDLLAAANGAVAVLTDHLAGHHPDLAELRDALAAVCDRILTP